MSTKKRILALLLSIALTLTAVPVSVQAATVKLNKKSVSVIVTKTVQLKVVNNKKKVKWTTSNKKIATVSKKGVVKGKKPGKATITAKVGKKSYKCKVTVKVGLNYTKKSLKKGNTLTLKLLGNSKKVKWSSSKKSVATVTSKGKVKAVNAGSATITAKVGSKKYKCKITVVNPSPTPTLSNKDAAKHIDFVVDVPAGRDIRVLQLTDTQILDAGQARPGRDGVDYEAWATDKMDEKCFNYVRETVKNTNPDLILITGDLIYGEFDDAGTSLQALIACMEELGVPWAPVFGNHDNESKKGADWQCAQLEAAKHCLFKQRTLTGNGNYTVGVRQGGKIKRVFFMLDSNGCSAMSKETENNKHSQKSAGFGFDQMEWYTETASNIKKCDKSIKLSFAFHIQIYAFFDAFYQYGFVNSETKNNPINIDKLPNKEGTDFGYLGRDLKGPWDGRYNVYDGLKDLGIDSIFVGHEHCNSASVVFDGIRFQYGQKTGTYDRANFLKADGTIEGSYSDIGKPIVGGTVIPLSEKDGSITNPYIYYCK